MSRVSPLRAVTATGLAAGVAALGLAFPSVALAELDLPAVSVPANVAAGTAFTVSGTGCVQLGKDYIGSVTAYVITDVPGMEAVTEVPEDGNWSVSLTFPAGTTGAHQLTAVCDDYFEPSPYPTATVTVGSAPTATTTPAKAVVTVKGGVTSVTAAPGQSLTPDTPATPGQRFALTLPSFAPNEKTTWVLHSTPRTLGTFTADASGTLSASLTIPAGVEAGDHELHVTRADGSVVKYPIRIAAAAGKRLADTGADVTVPLVAGGTLLLAGAGMLFAARRRSAGAPQA
jgi:LPXTG-motif cell wall-anchored protein